MNTESGRSMVEMLGVLAIIGVLSIGGIAGYTLAMNRYKANEVVNAMALASITAMTADGGEGKDLDASSNTYAKATGATLPSSVSAITTASKGNQVTAKFNASNEKVCTLVADIIGTSGSPKTNSSSCSGAAADNVVVWYS